MNPPPGSRGMTLEQKFNVALVIAHYSSLSVVVLFRRKVGVRQLSWELVLILVGLFGLACPLADGAFGPAKASDDPFPYRTALPPDKPVRAGYLGLFAAASLAMASRQRAQRWREFRRGVDWHSYHRGISVLSFLPLEHSAIVRLVEPAICVLLGFACWHWLSVALGLWLIFAGLSLRFVEQWVYKQNLQRTFDTIDGLIESEIHGETVQHYSESEPLRQSDPGLPTGLAPDIRKHIDARAGRQSAAGKATNAPPAKKPGQMTKQPLTMRQRFWRFFWGRHVWEWWQRRQGR